MIHPPMPLQPIPTFYLYGEPHRLVDKGFVHVEALDDRSRPSEWTIQPHAHADLTHLILISSGGGAMRVDGAEIRFDAPAFLLIPAATVHGFEWFEESEGFVVTLAGSYLMELIRQDDDLAELFRKPSAVAIAPDCLEQVEAHIRELMRELVWSAPGWRATINAAMLSLFVIALRGQSAGTALTPVATSQATSVARLRERIEQRFRLREPVSAYASALGVSQTALRLACARVAGRSPAEMLDQRALLEARRALLYSTVPIGEIGFSLGFSDPAYFSRFFQRNMGVSARAYRAAGVSVSAPA
jgi:AraC family transcriptional activator of pobA